MIGGEPPGANVGEDGHAALINAVHVFHEAIIPVIRRQVDPRYVHGGLAINTVASVTGNGKPVAWELIVGPPAYTGVPMGAVREAIDHLALMQGIMDSITPVLEQRTGHWFKVVLGRGTDHRVFGDVKVDGVPIGVAPSFEAADWRNADTFSVRQFGIVMPAATTDPALLANLVGVSGEAPARPSLLRRLIGR